MTALLISNLIWAILFYLEWCRNNLEQAAIWKAIGSVAEASYGISEVVRESFKANPTNDERNG